METQLETAIWHENIKIALRSITPGVLLTTLDFKYDGVDILSDTLGYFLLWLGMYRLRFYTTELALPITLAVIMGIASSVRFIQVKSIHYQPPEDMYEAMFVNLYFGLGHLWILIELFSWMARAGSKMGVQGMRRKTTTFFLIMGAINIGQIIFFLFFGKEVNYYLFPSMLALWIAWILYMDYLKVLFGNAVMQETNLEAMKAALDPEMH